MLSLTLTLYYYGSYYSYRSSYCYSKDQHYHWCLGS
nr:MAG TPA: hypothetical protein [Crassvirales sp.]